MNLAGRVEFPMNLLRLKNQIKKRLAVKGVDFRAAPIVTQRVSGKGGVRMGKSSQRDTLLRKIGAVPCKSGIGRIVSIKFSRKKIITGIGWKDAGQPRHPLAELLHRKIIRTHADLNVVPEAVHIFGQRAC